ncbi:hypothetical protein SDC9_136272 [bioreactor metagenome]|uniref:Uncharacterized protein n=1 Tax=bioreactor metagenome TaxID=1076179 RepID=A0A645DI42_9ZZZZ
MQLRAKPAIAVAQFFEFLIGHRPDGVPTVAQLPEPPGGVDQSVIRNRGQFFQLETNIHLERIMLPARQIAHLALGVGPTPEIPVQTQNLLLQVHQFRRQVGQHVHHPRKFIKRGLAGGELRQFVFIPCGAEIGVYFTGDVQRQLLGRPNPPLIVFPDLSRGHKTRFEFRRPRGVIQSGIPPVGDHILPGFPIFRGDQLFHLRGQAFGQRIGQLVGQAENGQQAAVGGERLGVEAAVFAAQVVEVEAALQVDDATADAGAFVAQRRQFARPVLVQRVDGIAGAVGGEQGAGVGDGVARLLGGLGLVAGAVHVVDPGVEVGQQRRHGRADQGHDKQRGDDSGADAIPEPQ